VSRLSASARMSPSSSPARRFFSLSSALDWRRSFSAEVGKSRQRRVELESKRGARRTQLVVVLERNDLGAILVGNMSDKL
jgi:hypothetical protein